MKFGQNLIWESRKWSELEVYIPDPDPTRKSGSFGLARDYVGSGSGSDFNFRVEIGFKVLVFIIQVFFRE